MWQPEYFNTSSLIDHITDSRDGLPTYATLSPHSTQYHTRNTLQSKGPFLTTHVDIYNQARQRVGQLTFEGGRTSKYAKEYLPYEQLTIIPYIPLTIINQPLPHARCTIYENSQGNTRRLDENKAFGFWLTSDLRDPLPSHMLLKNHTVHLQDFCDF